MDHYIRLVVFVVEGCPQPLVELFLKKAKADLRPGVPYSCIDSYLQYHQTTIQNMLRKGFIHVDQIPLILPDPTTDPPVDINKWDISLVTTMLQNIFKPLSPQEQRYIGDIRTVRNELLHKSGIAELDDSDFIAKWNTLETAVSGLAQCVGTDCNNEMTSYITSLKTKSLPPPGPILDILKQWYTADQELNRDTKLALAATKGTKNILNDVIVRRTKPSGKVMKKIKSVDPVLESMREKFKLTIKRIRKKNYLPPDEIEDVKSNFRLYHRVSITGKGGLELALAVINDQDIQHDRCVQVTEAYECRHVWCDDVDLVLCINPFGKDIYDDKKAMEMTKQFDRMLENTNLADIDGRIDVIIVSETEPFLEYCRLHDHDLLDQVVTLNKSTADAEPIQLSDCLMKVTHQPESILQNMKGHTEVYLDQLRSYHIEDTVTIRTKSLFKKRKAITITGPPHLRKDVLAERLMSDYRRDECLVLTNPEDWKYVKLGDVSVILINDLTGKGKCDQALYRKWLSIFDLIHAAVKDGKLNVILTSHSAYLQECQSQIGTHDLLEQHVELTDEGMVKTIIKIEDCTPEAGPSSHVKGFIPIEDEEFPKYINRFKTDVREGFFELYNPGNVQIGCAIGAQTDNGEIKSIGTLGPFLELPGESKVICSLTSAHVVYNETDMNNLVSFREKQENADILKVYSDPASHTSKQYLGYVTKAVYRQGGENGEAGCEAALIRIITEPSLLASGFPGDINDEYLSESRFTSGIFYEKVEYIPQHSIAYKYGCGTKLTKGSFKINGASVRTDTLNNAKFGVCLRNQVEMQRIGNDSFATYGDSGALVFVPHGSNNNDLRAVGIISGGSVDGCSIFVSPICDILKALGLSTVKRLKTFSSEEAMDVDDSENITSDSNFNKEVLQELRNIKERQEKVEEQQQKIEEHYTDVDNKLDIIIKRLTGNADNVVQ